MHAKFSVTLSLVATLAGSLCLAQTATLNPATLPRIATVDDRFQSYNVEMVEVTGGRFWAPYTAKTAAAEPPSAASSAPAGMDPSLYRYRQPIDLSNPRLRKLARALGPAYIRVSGTWANNTFFQDSDAPAPDKPPTGFGNVLTRAEWKGVIDFAHATDAKIVSSFSVSAGVRDASGVWTPIEAKPFLAFTKQAGGEIAAAEMFNEPNLATIGGAPKGYDAAAYGRDFKAFKAFTATAAPTMKILGPGAVGEGGSLGEIPGGGARLTTPDMLAAEDSGPHAGLDVFSYHYYGGVSKRCAALGAARQTTPEAALTPAWLNRTNQDAKYYIGLRDRLTPGLPIWLTETGETACGGNPWASTFLDTFRYLNQLGTLARQNVQVVAHNTLAASDYALIDESTLTPRPNYWGALLWRQLMGTTVLDAGPQPTPNLYLYAHCRRSRPGAVTLLILNADRAATQTLRLPAPAERYTLSSTDLLTPTAQLNGKPLQLGPGDTLPGLNPQPLPPGLIQFAPATITFLTIPGAANPACTR